MVLCGLMSDLSGVWSTGTCHPRQCSSSDCRGTQLIRRGNDGSMLLASASFSGGVFPSGFSFSPSARHPFYLFLAWIIYKAITHNLTCFYLADFVRKFYYICRRFGDEIVAVKQKWITQAEGHIEHGVFSGRI